jgi:hypothetical protein
MRRLLSRAWLLTLAALLVLAVLRPGTGAGRVPAAPAVSVGPRTLVTTSYITAFAQDGKTIAWIGSDHYSVRAKDLATGKAAILGTAGGSSCHLQSPALAVAGTRVLWTSCAIGTELYVEGRTTTLEERLRARPPKPVALFEIGQGEDDCSRGGYFAGAAGDGKGGLVYGWLDIGPPVPDQSACDYIGPDRAVTGGGVKLVGEPPIEGPPIPNVPGPLPMYNGRGGQLEFTHQLSVSRGHIAVLAPPSAIPGDAYGPLLPRPAENGPVSTYTLGGALVSQVFPPGTVREIALSWPRLAVLVRRPDGSQVIAWYDAARGVRETYVGVPPGASDIALGTTGIVFRIGNGIYTAGDGAYTLLWTASGRPIGLSIEGRRVAWAVDSAGRGRAVSFTLPSS